MIELVDLHKQYLSIKDEIDSAIKVVIDSSAFVGSKTVERFEGAFAEYTGAKHCIAVANGTDALELAIEALGIKDKYIVVPAMTATPTVEAVVRTGNAPIFCDTDETCTLNIEKFEEIIGEYPVSAVIPVHLYGAPANMYSIKRIACKNNIVIIEDCAQAHGTKFDGIHVGTTGEAGCFSFYPGKNLGAFGDAGAIITNSDNMFNHLRMLRDHGRVGKFAHAIVGRNSRMDGIQAAILEVKLHHLDKWISARQKNAQYYNQRFIGYGVLPTWTYFPKNQYTYHQYPILVLDRDRLWQSLLNRGIRAGMHYPFILPSLPCYQKYAMDSYISARAIAEHEISLPVHEMLSQEDLDVVINVVEEHYDRV